MPGTDRNVCPASFPLDEVTIRPCPRIPVNTCTTLGVLLKGTQEYKYRARREAPWFTQSYCAQWFTVHSFLSSPYRSASLRETRTLSLRVSPPTNGAHLHPSLAGMAAQSNGRRSRGPRTCPVSWSIFAIPVSNSACAAQFEWRHRSSISTTRGKRLSRSR